MKSHVSVLAAALSLVGVACVAATFAAIAQGCIVDKRAGSCGVDADCAGNAAGGVCVAGACVQCRDSSTCAAESFCCQGTCHPAGDIDTHCGCGPAPTDSPGQTCASSSTPDGLCLVGATTALPSNVGQGTCGCGCTPDQGGPTCVPPSTPGDVPECRCVENTDCRKESEDAHGVPHRAADTCTPGGSCVCFAALPQTACNPDGGAPDCSASAGCQNLATNKHNCGKGGVDCSVAATGLDDGTGTCIDGGCACDAATDCTGNTDSCAIVTTSPAQCVCASYRVPDANGQQAACPLELDCTPQGCQFDGTAYATEKDLLTALGLPAPPSP